MDSFLTVDKYRQLTGLLRTTATNELKECAVRPDSGIDMPDVGRKGFM